MEVLKKGMPRLPQRARKNNEADRAKDIKETVFISNYFAREIANRDPNFDSIAEDVLSKQAGAYIDLEEPEKEKGRKLGKEVWARKSRSKGKTREKLLKKHRDAALKRLIVYIT